MKESENKKQKQEEKQTIVSNLQKAIVKFTDSVDGFIYPLIIPPIQSIDEDILFEIYPDLRKVGKQKKLHVLLYSYGGDAHTAFHIGRLLQEYSSELSIYVLREAKSAATLISCAADRIVFSEISELGPMDPQISRSDEPGRFSPLAIKHTFDLLHQQSEEGHSQIVKVLTDKLPDPLILGEHLKSLETGKDYLCKLMNSRMFSGDAEKAIQVSEKLVTGYPDHGYCIDFVEAKSIGLKVEKVEEKHEETILEIMKSYKNVWDKFDFHLKKARNAETVKDKDAQFKEAFDLYDDLKKLATEVIKHQQDKKTPPTPKRKTSKKKK
ncbi:hypothetical protein COU15_02400 [Candidatus Kaiserbacteria bacterium CG10_big_fil_rev_8_21_14_0_10_45_20]|uniref:Peptidase S49 domain-containing protein n=1 Tax=Candidatus Kaiserbacteria bacterium CG10_big_fil_rev_8_21_14_0_10_45_20 TaxID=1974607 RepID=A0A2H0UFP8_9BACT|nr:MAG: hypothetical protein COU15_02400 [Candidatus Kaiserbacteria bacterium CG10_big_fil_rev_8_21_14_0_10_45_20]